MRDHTRLNIEDVTRDSPADHCLIHIRDEDGEETQVIIRTERATVAITDATGEEIHASLTQCWNSSDLEQRWWCPFSFAGRSRSRKRWAPLISNYIENPLWRRGIEEPGSLEKQF